MEREEKAYIYRKQALKNLTPYEIYFKKYIKSLYYVQQKNFFYGKYIFYRVDFYIPSLKLVIEIDGKQHSTPENIKYDAKRTRHLKKLGVKKVLRFKNEEVFDKELILSTLRLAIHELSPNKTKRQKKNKGTRIVASRRKKKKV